MKTDVPAWRARIGGSSRSKFPLVQMSASMHERLHERAQAEGVTGRWLADVLINRALDEAGAP